MPKNEASTLRAVQQNYFRESVQLCLRVAASAKQGARDDD